MSIEQPYIGVTGISNPDDARSVANAFRQSVAPEDSHCGVIGYLASNQTLENQPSEYSKYPSLNNLSLLLDLTSDSINAIHYKTSNPNELSSEVYELVKKVSSPVDLLQINARFPDPHQVENIKSQLPHLKIVLPIGKRSLEGLSREQIVDNLSHYDNNISYILLDPSGGTGKSLNVDLTTQLYRKLRDCFPNKGIVFAGGFNPDNIIRQLALLVATLKTDDFGVDVESGVRIEKDADPHSGKFSSTEASKFIQKVSGFFN